MTHVVKAEIRSLGRSDASTLEGLYESYAPGLRRRCLRLTHDCHAADDLMQEVFVRFIARFPEPPASMNVGAYLHATARNVLWKQLRNSHEVVDGDIETTVGADDDLDNDPERSALLGEQQSLVRRCAAVLTGRQRRALTMRDVEGRSYDEIGSELGLGVGAVMQVISRARARLRVAVRRANVDLDQLAPECRAMLGPLSDYLDGRAASAAGEIESHLATCDACCQTLASFQEAGSRLRGAGPLVPIAGMLARVAAFARGDAPLGVGAAASLVTAAVIAVSGGGLLVAQQLTDSHRTHSAALLGTPHAGTTTNVPRADTTPIPLVATPAHGPASTAGPRHAAMPTTRNHALTAQPRTTASPTPATTPQASPPVEPTSIPKTLPETAPTGTQPGTSAPTATPTTTTTPGSGTPPPTTTTPNSANRTSLQVSIPSVTVPGVTVPSVTVPVLTTPAVSVPSVVVPPITTPGITTPVGNVPPVSTPSISTPSVTVPAISTPTISTPIIKTPALTTPKLP